MKNNFKTLVIILFSINVAHLSYANSFYKKEKTIIVAENQVTRLNCIIEKPTSGRFSMQWIRSFIPLNYSIEITSKAGTAGKHVLQTVRHFKDKISFNFSIKNSGDLDSQIKHIYFKRTKKLSLSFYIPEKHYLFGDGGALHHHRGFGILWGNCKEEVLIASADLINKINSTGILNSDRKKEKKQQVTEAKKIENNFLSVQKDADKGMTKLEADIKNDKRKAKEKNRQILKLEKKLAKLQNNQKKIQKKIILDTQKPSINAFFELNDTIAIVYGRVTDNTQVSEIFIDGQLQQLNSNEIFKTEVYVPRSGKIIEIIAVDTKGNKASKILKIERAPIQQASGPKFHSLNPTLKKVKSNPNAFALIIGVADYEKTPANALYADKDAQQFYDYATMKLGIPSSNIKELVNDKADLGEILINVKDWLRRSAKPNKSDIYIYFAGHGLASQDGTKMYLLPYDGRPRLLENTALLRDELFKDIKQANPRSVTVFLDTCYSGVTRNEEMLIAGRPIVIKAKEQAIPEGFTLFSAASNEQISRPLEEAKHGMFSYFLMKGMEGDADANNDNKITARELHAYVEQNVVQQSSGSQTPELQGDKDRVLVQFN